MTTITGLRVSRPLGLSLTISRWGERRSHREATQELKGVKAHLQILITIRMTPLCMGVTCHWWSRTWRIRSATRRQWKIKKLKSSKSAMVSWVDLCHLVCRKLASVVSRIVKIRAASTRTIRTKWWICHLQEAKPQDKLLASIRIILRQELVVESHPAPKLWFSKHSLPNGIQQMTSK